MTFRPTGFTFIELMIVVAVIALLAGVLFPQMSGYYARGRDVARISDIKALSAAFQNYARTNSIYPNNINKDGDTSYCISDIRSWDDALPQFKDRQYSQLGGTGMLRSDPMATNTPFSPTPTTGCNKVGSYQYARIDKETSYSVLAARMERQTTGANYTYPDTGSQYTQLKDVNYIDTMLRAQPLDKSGDDENKIFLIITN